MDFVWKAAVIFLAAVFSYPALWPAHGFTHLPHGERLPDFDKRRQERRPDKPTPPGRRASVDKLRQQLPGIRIELDELRKTPKQVMAARGFLTGPNGEGKAVPPGRARQMGQGDPHGPIKVFLEEHAGLFGQGSDLLAGARVKRDYVARNNRLRTVAWEQNLDGIEVHEGVLVGHVTARGELVTVSSLMIPQAAQAADRGTPERRRNQATPPISAAQALLVAIEQIGEVALATEIVPLAPAPAGPELRQSFKVTKLPGEATARLIWLPLGEDALRLCWEVEVTRREGGERYRVLVDALSAETQLRQRLTVYLSEASYRVFTGDSPTPLSPGWAMPDTNQPPLVERTLVTLSALNTNASPIGWISDGDNETRGNNVDAHTDGNADDQPDLPRPEGLPFRVFDPTLDFSQAPGASGNAAVVQLFYWCNWLHDRLYELGFTEAAGNYQKDNFARGGAGNDAIQADALDGSGFNNANFTPSSDGVAGRIQMFLWNGPNPDLDGDFDSEVVIHEYVHGLSTRLVGGGVGIGTIQAAGMGEGWSDFYALALLSEPGDDPEGTYPFGAYVSHLLNGLQENYYFGIRRYPYSTDLTKNPLTFKDIDPTQVSRHAGVPLSPLIGFNPINASEVHAQGEVWCAALWDGRANLIRKHGYSVGNELALQLVTDGMKLSPPNPNFLQARDAILLADQISHEGANYSELWTAFARRGMGFSARSPDSTTTLGVMEAFDLPDALFISTAGGLFASGPPGGPFAPECAVFPLTNISEQTISWTVILREPWLRADPVKGTLAPGQSIAVSVCLSTNLETMPAGSYSEDIAFVNLTSGVVQTRRAELRVMSLRTLPFLEDFETGELEDYWSWSGTERARATVTQLNEPQAGDFHLTLDAQGGIRSRNELTLGLDLAGYTNVVLKYWAKTFGDEPDGPPLSPFEGGADFDGVAISEDGVSWYEVRSLRFLPLEYAEVTVDLDAAIAMHGLSYSPNFRVRFNQVDEFQIPFDGLGLDDIRITGIAARRFAVSVASRAVEGSGVLTNLGIIRLGEPVEQDLAVQLTSSHPGRVSVPGLVTIRAGSDQVTFQVNVLENALLDGTERVMVTASAAGYYSGSASVEVVDNETAKLRVSIPPRAREGDGMLKKQGVVRSSARPVSDVAVRLTSSVPEKIRVPATVVLPAGAKDAEFDLTVLDDSKIDGAHSVVITATVDNWEHGADSILVLDNDSPALELSLPPALSENNGVVPGSGRVRVSGTLPTNLVVFLSSSDLTELRVPASVVVPAGQLQVLIDLEAVNDTAVDGRQTATVTAQAPGFASAAEAIAILDDETPVVPYQPDPENGATNVPVSLSLQWGSGSGEVVVNGGFETGDFTGWVNLNNGYGAWVINDGKMDPEGPDGPSEPLAGQFNAMTVQIGAGDHLLYQDVFIPDDALSATFSWTDRIRNHGVYYSSPNQEFRVEVRDTNNVVLDVLFKTRPGETNLHPTTRRSFDVSRFRGRPIRIAFYQQDNLGYFNVALDDVSVQLGAPESATEFQVYFGISPTLTPADLQGTITNAFWPLSGLKLNTTYYWQVVARRDAGMSPGPVWKFTTRGVGPVDHFDWAPIASPQFVGRRFAVAVTARDDIGNVVQNFAGPARVMGLAGSGTRSRMVISEIDIGGEDRVEFANVSASAVDLSGWRISVYDVTSWPEPRASVTVPAGSVCAEGQVFVLNDGGEKLGTFPVFNSMTNVNWNNAAIGNPIAVLVQDATGAVVDFVAAGDAVPSAITLPRRIPPGEWSGHPILAVMQSGLVTLQRVGSSDGDVAADWVVASSTFGTDNLDLKLPFPWRDLVSVAPAEMTNFVGGVWSGYLTVNEPVSGMILRAENLDGRAGNSGGFAVGGLNDLAVTVADLPDVVILGDPVTYQLTVTNTGPDSASGVRLTNDLPASVEFVSVATFSGACSNEAGRVRCELQDLSAGDSARITIVARTLEAGLITNVASVAQLQPEGFTQNNRALAWTTVSGPFISTTNVNVLEGTGTTPTIAQVPVVLSAPCVFPVSVAYETSNFTAVAGQDFQGMSGRLEFPPGVTYLTLELPVTADSLDEFGELFLVNFFAPSNGIISVSQSRCRIFDDDQTPFVTADDVTVIEGPPGGTAEAVFQFRLSTPSGLTAQIGFATADDTAKAPEDYRTVFGTLVFSPGVTNQSVVVPVRGDRRFEPGETFFLKLLNPVSCVPNRVQAVGTIVDDDAAELDHFEWSDIGSPQVAGVPFSTVLTAKDGMGRVATAYGGSVSIKASAESREAEVGAGTNLWNIPLGTLFHDTRAQVIYLPEELGGPGSLNAIGLEIAKLPGQVLSNWTIRLKHTTARSYGRAAWDAEGWATVFQGDETIVSSGWTSFPFDVPFNYDGTNALAVDFSFDNASYSEDGLVRSMATESNRSIYFQSDSAFGEPTKWAGTNPPPQLSVRVPNARFRFERGLAISPASPVALANGIWAGMVVIHDAATNAFLRANDGMGHIATGNLFDVLPAEDGNLDGLPDAWQSSRFGGVNAAEASPEADPDLDGLTNRDEFLAGTHPLDPTSNTAIVRIEVHGGDVILTFATVPGRAYRVERADSLVVSSWVPVATGLRAAGAELEHVDRGGARLSKGFYRVRMEP